MAAKKETKNNANGNAKATNNANGNAKATKDAEAKGNGMLEVLLAVDLAGL